MTLTYAEIAEIIKLIDASSCEEITLDLGEIRLSMRRQGTGGPARTTINPAPPPRQQDGQAVPQPEPDGEPEAPSLHQSGAGAKTAGTDGTIEIRSPMVGTFYRSPSPISPPFVEAGDTVKEDDPLCLIEVMKLYTTISAKGPGRIAEICVENGAMVGADEILFRIESL